MPSSRRTTGSGTRTTIACSTSISRAVKPCSKSLSDDPRIETELLAGPPAEAIVRVAAARDADEIVVGSRGFGAARAALGSVSHKLLHLADRPVVVIPAPDDPGDAP